ncbi:hypothetical protein [Curtobacterium flaccumfaciens]|uniref:hypothetical protein n=1 Tax=Curtobacterium flaccumfaciens TaxID=2035 RepID=UPI001E4142EC|nr:hypothetical protein [Curtobacterium allii]MCE0459696.1 hypothetical protein [Curtobacterium allii]
MVGSERRFDVENEVAFIELALRARELQVDADAIDRVRRMLQGTLTRNQARAEIVAKYRRHLPLNVNYRGE